MCCYIRDSKFVVHRYNVGDAAIYKGRNIIVVRVIPSTEQGGTTYRVNDGLNELSANENNLTPVEVETSAEVDHAVV